MRAFLSVLLLMVAPATPVSAASSWAQEPAYIAIVIDDLGNRMDTGRRALALPSQIGLSMLPHTPYARSLAESAQVVGHEVLLHQPLEAMEPGPLGEGAIVMRTDRDELQRILGENIAALPHVVGINNHMGSRLTQHSEHMDWLMQDLAGRGDLYFIDSRTTAETVAFRSAQAHGVPSLERDVFLDWDPTPESVAAEFERLIEVARRDGYALAIGHPLSVTLDHLEAALPTLEAAGVVLVSPSELIDIAESMRAAPWRMSAVPAATPRYEPSP